MTARHLLSRAAYRTRQFLHGLRAWLAPAEIVEARERLSPPELALFLAADDRDRRHSYDLYAALRAEGASDAALRAALLHDVGKGRLATWQRVAFVMLDATAPRWARRIEAEHGAGWRRALWRLRHHARLGAEALAAAGSDPRVIAIVAAHTQPPPPDDAELARFIALDGSF